MPRIETLAARAGSAPDPASGALAPPLQLATTFQHTPDAQLPHGFLYQRYDNPTQQETEQVLAALEGAARSLLFPTGMAAGAVALQALPAGSHVLLCDDSYFSFRALAAQRVETAHLLAEQLVFLPEILHDLVHHHVKGADTLDVVGTRLVCMRIETGRNDRHHLGPVTDNVRHIAVIRVQRDTDAQGFVLRPGRGRQQAGRGQDDQQDAEFQQEG